MAKASKRGGSTPGRQGPTGKEVMRRAPPDDLTLRPTRFESDPKKAYSTDQLAEIGAIAVKFNQLEAHIDFIGSHILFSKTPWWLHLSIAETLSTNKMLELLEQCVVKATLFDETAKARITDTFQHFRTYRSYRNAIVHHSIFDHEKGIGFYIDESKKPFQIMVSPEALKNLYNLICVVLDEIREVDLLFRIETDAQRPIILNPATGEHEPYPTKLLRERVIPDRTRELVRLQTQRKSLPQLPTFPDADLIRARWEESTCRPGPGETAPA